jgi:hypothetical protein
MKITALKRHSYRNRSIAVGESYEADVQFAPVLVAARVARYADREMRPEFPRMAPAPVEFVQPVIKKPRAPRKKKAN